MDHHLKETSAVAAQTYSMSDLMDLLVASVGLPPAARTEDRTTTFSELGLDSLAYLQLQTELKQRYGVEVADDGSDPRLGELVDAVNAGAGAASR
jgi:acyl carrier protein